MPSPARLIALADLEAALEGLWQELARPASADQAGAPSLAWRAAYTPLFPAAWPPTASTVWVRYGFAYGHDLRLRDGMRVAQPWARIEVLAGQARARLTPLRESLEACAVQGVRPLAGDELAVLQSGAEVERYAGGLARLPELEAPATGRMRVYYLTWLALNGAVAQALAPDHAEFFGWLRAP